MGKNDTDPRNMFNTEFEDLFSEEVWNSTYKDYNDKTINDTLFRVAKAAAGVESTPELQKTWTTNFYDLLSNFKGTSGGRIYSNAGTEWKGTTLMNCISGDTKIITSEGIVNAADIDGKTVNVLTGHGKFQSVDWKCYGTQNLYKITLSNNEIIHTTRDHEWIVTKRSGGTEKVTTEQLQNRRIPLNGIKEYTYTSDADYKNGIRNGLVFGDGYVYTDFSANVKYSALQQFGNSRHLILDYFDWLKVANYKGDPEGIHYVNGQPEELKYLPSLNKSLDYLRGFIAGVIAAAGCVDTRGSVVLHTANYEYAVQLKNIAVRAGLPVISLRLDRENSPFDGKRGELWKLTFVKKYFKNDDKLILKNSHIENMKNSPSVDKITSIKCVSVEKTNRSEKVYCCNEPTTHTFTLGEFGILTGNCFVSPRRKHDIDSLDGILEDVRNQSFTLKSEGGWGENFSYIRPRGFFIHGIGVETPGAVKYMEVFDKTSEIITAGAGKKTQNKKAKGKIRKGAMMGVLDCWHPDIIEFISAKQQGGRLTKFNMSVNCTDNFMEKVLKVIELKKEKAPKTEIEEVDAWNLVFPDTTFEKYKAEWDGNLKKWEEKGYPIKVAQTVSASWLWNLIMESTYNRAEPGVLFLDRANYFGPLSYKETISATNPCVTGDTVVYVADGRGDVSIQQLAKEGKDVPVFCYDEYKKITIKTMRNPRITGYNEDIYEILLDDGSVIKCTNNHKFLTLNNTYVETKDLKPGESLKVLTKYHASIKEIFPKANSNSSDYIWIKNGIKASKSEHRIIAEYYSNNPIPKNHVVHHENFNSLDNSKDNLRIMLKKDHDKLHGENMKGENNPMVRAKTEWSKEKWQEYRNNMSTAVSGEKNGNYSGVSNEEYIAHAKKFIKELNRRFSVVEWKKYCKENNLPSLFSGFRLNQFSSFSSFSLYIAKSCGLDEEFSKLNNRTQRTFNEMINQGYECKIIDNTTHVKKKCETCNNDFWIESYKRETSFCSVDCSSKYVNIQNKLPHMQKKIKKNQENAYKERKEKDRIKQATAYNDVKFSLLKKSKNRNPLKKEWENKCKENNIRFKLGQHSPFNTYKELKEFASNINHRVVSVKYIGKGTVYNGTVDDHHNFFVGGFESKTLSGKKKFLYINNLNCGEQTLSPGGVCNLGSLNLTQFINTTRTGFNLSRIKKYVSIMVRFLDNINSLSEAPLPEYVKSMREKRRIGIGILGWGSALYILKIKFGSEDAAKLRDKVMSTIAREAYMASIDLAIEKGMFKECDPKKHAEGHFLNSLNLPKEYMDKLASTGIRNSSLLSIQPTGNTSIQANIVSGGLEPVFMHEYIRTVIINTMPDEIASVTPVWYEGEWHETELFKFAKEGDEEILKGKASDGTVYKIDKNRGLTKEVLCEDYGVRYLKRIDEWDPSADWAVTTDNLTVEDHVNDLKGFARWVDSAMSKTVNVPQNYPFEKFQNIYLDSYKSGYVKGVTTYRSGIMTTVLSAKEEKDAEPDDEEIIKEDVKLPDSANAVVKTIRAENRKWYLTVVYHENQQRPFALFVKTNAREKGVVADDAIELLFKLARKKKIPKRHIDAVDDKLGADDNSSKVARLISFLLRHGVLIKNIVATLDKVETAYVGTFVFQIKKFLSSYIKDGEKVEDEICQECGSVNIVFSEGCKKCMSCGSSKCG